VFWEQFPGRVGSFGLPFSFQAAAVITVTTVIIVITTPSLQMAAETSQRRLDGSSAPDRTRSIPGDDDAHSALYSPVLLSPIFPRRRSDRRWIHEKKVSNLGIT